MFNPKRLLPILGTLLLGVLGSALWEAVRNPLTWVSSVLLSLVTLGLDSLRDSIYRDAAAQVPERAGTTILSMALGLISGVAIGSIRLRWAASRLFKDDDINTEINSQSVKLRQRSRSKSILPWLLFTLLATVLILGNREIYVVRASAYINQLQQIASPFISNEHAKSLRSSFAQVQTRAEYVSLVESLLSVIKNNNAHAPIFSVF
jgi:hypothetical protein